MVGIYEGRKAEMTRNVQRKDERESVEDTLESREGKQG